MKIRTSFTIKFLAQTLILFLSANLAYAIDLADYYSKWWEREAVFKDQVESQGIYTVMFSIERKINQQHSLIASVRVSKGNKILFEIDESATIALLEKNKNSLTLVVPLSLEGATNVSLVTHQVTSSGVKTTCHKPELAKNSKSDNKKNKVVRAKLSEVYGKENDRGFAEGKTQSAEEAEYSNEVFRFRKYLKQVGCL